MPCRILTQHDMQAVRRAIDFCYLCGQPLPERRRGTGSGVVGEHVVPRSLLGDPPTPGAWPVILDVHEDCEDTLKRGRDHWASTLQAINTVSPTDWPEWGHVRGLPIEPVVLLDEVSGKVIPAFTGIGAILHGIATWVRGFHAALYRLPLPDDVAIHVRPPVPACSSTGPTTLQLTEDLASASVQVVMAATLTDQWDGIQAWGDELRYYCTWWNLGRLDGGDGPWTCFWVLTFPGVLEWSSTVTESVRPWNGHYEMPAPPPGAGCVSQDHFNVLSDFVARANQASS